MIIHVIVVFSIPRQEQGQPLGHSSATHTLTCDLPVPLPRAGVNVRVDGQRPGGKPVWVYLWVW